MKKKNPDFEIIPRKKNKGRPSKRPSVSKLAREYSKKSTKDIAQKYGVSESTVRSWVFKARRGY